MDRSAHLGQLVRELESNPGYASGRRSFPRTVTGEDAADIAEAVHAQIDAGTRERARVAAETGMKIACARGCNRCCEELVMVPVGEAEAVARWLKRPENAAILAGFRERYPAWRARLGDLPERLEAAADRGDNEYYKQVFMTDVNARVLCAFNVGGDCQIYQARPILCRKAHSLDTPDLCGPHDPALRRQEIAFVPLDSLVKRSFSLFLAAHHAVLGAKAPQRALCDQVYQLTTPA